MNKKLTALVLSGALVCAMGAQALAATIGEEPDETPVLYTGKITEILKDANGSVTGLQMESERNGSYVMNVSEETVWIDNKAYAAFNPSNLAVGENLYVYHSPISTRSMPPQSAAFAVVRGVLSDGDVATYHVVEGVETQEDGSIRITTDNGGLYLFAGKETKVAPYLSNGSTELENLQAGDRIMAWYSVVMLSYPGQAHPSAIMILPETAAETETPAEGAKLTIQLDGNVTELTGRYESGVAMVPVAAVARAMGLETTYTREETGALVKVESDQFSVRIDIGQKLISGVTKIANALGATGPQDYGKAAYIEAPGTTWAPAQLFSMLGKTVSLEGDVLSIQS